MKKLITATLVLMLASISFGTSSVKAAGDSRADVFYKGNDLYNTIKVTKALHNSPSDPSVVNYVSPIQDVKIIRSAFLINSYNGHTWIRYNSYRLAGPSTMRMKDRYLIPMDLDKDFNASNATLKVNSHLPARTSIYDSSIGGNEVGSLTPQTVDVRQAWYEIETWLGPKWIGYQLR
ncbi:hypothetical protein [Priestia taiwanensis]|uniref:Uncharacterized protein n=1 Tax=Priestia taiwanensis TaxID=1347902 RepID=A0A917AP12_9BACI|nr:hypothetical protein [Priestia taiwanensis]MBM7362592.1 hypothetical protein [Priestia taiwanensis]GGE63497.1 hypothetical protein GCM10007140_12170 [Priestia taiwanensis]